jgi:hypothetical protein
MLTLLFAYNFLFFQNTNTDFIEIKAKPDKSVIGLNYPYCGIAYIKEKIIFTSLLSERNKLYLKPQSQFVYEVGCPRETLEKNILTKNTYTLRIKWSLEDSIYYISSIKELE